MSPAPTALPRNPGPSWGYQFLSATDRVLPEPVFRPLRALGTAIALLAMPAQRACSRAYLTTVLRRKPTIREVFRHFFAFEEVLMKRLRLANGRPYPCDFAPDADAFARWLETQPPMLLGTVHVGPSDMMGFQLAGLLRHPVYLVRQRVGNSHDTEAMASRFGSAVRFVWVNETREMLFALKEALSTPSTVAIQCDRVAHGARTASFEFLGARREFPITIYHLAVIFDRPVILCFGTPGAPGRSLLHSSPLFQPTRGESRAAALRRACDHFQAFLRQLEVQLRQNPYLWFNFTPLNPATNSGR